MEEKKFFNEIINTFENEDIKEFCDKCLDTIPNYFWHVGASSSGKYHPDYALGDHGLARHTLALCRIMNHMFSVDCIKSQFTSRERDLLRIAGLMHDTRKSGSQEDYDKSKWTKFNHPILSSNEIAKVWNNNKTIISIDEAKLIRRVIESHMGEWNTDKRSQDVILPIPQDKYQILLHLCDYLASRKDIEIKFNDSENNISTNDTKDKKSLPNINTWKIPFGRYKGKTVIEVKEEDPTYLDWVKKNVEPGIFRTMVDQLK